MVNFERQFFISIDRLRSPTLIILAAVGILGLGGAGAHAQIDSMIQACVASIKVDGRRDFDEQKWDLDFSDLAACTAAAKQHPKNVQVKGLLAFARLKGGVYERRAATAAVAELAAAAKAGDPFALYIYGRAQIDSLFMFADVKKNSIAGRAAIELAAKAGYPDAAYFLSRSTSGSRYSLETKNSLGAPDWRDRDAAEADVADARHWLEMAVRGGHAHAKAALAELLIKKDPSAAQEAHSPIIARAFALLDEALADQAISAADAARLLDEKTLKGDAQSQRPPLIAKITMALYDAMGKGGKERFDAAEALAEKILPVAVESRRAEIADHLLNFFSQALAADEFAVLSERDSERDFDKPSHHALFTLSNGLSKNLMPALSLARRNEFSDRIVTLLETAVAKNVMSRGDLPFHLQYDLGEHMSVASRTRAKARVTELYEAIIADPKASRTEKGKALRSFGGLLIKGRWLGQDIERGVSLMFEADRIGGIDLASQDSPHFTLQEMGLCRPARKQLAQIDLKKLKAELDPIWYSMATATVTLLSRAYGCTIQNEADVRLLETLSKNGYLFADSELTWAFGDGRVVLADPVRALRSAKDYRAKSSATGALSLLLTRPALAHHSTAWTSFLRETAAAANRELKEKPNDRNAWQFDEVGRTKVFGLDTRRDVQAGLELIEIAAAHGEDDAKAFLIMKALRDSTTDADWSQAVEKAIDFSPKHPDENLVMVRTVAHSLARAVSWRGAPLDRFTRVLEEVIRAEWKAGETSRLRLANLLLDGLVVPASPTRAANRFAEDAAAGHAEAAGTLAMLHIRGVGVPRDLAAARRLIEAHAAATAPEIAYARSLLNIATGNVATSVIENDLASAAARGFMPARRSLALLLLADKARAAEGWSLLEALDRDGDPMAAFAIGERFRKGAGVPKAPEAARYFYDRADALGVLEAGLALLVLAADANEIDFENQVGAFLTRFDPRIRESGRALDGVVPPDVVARLAAAHAARDHAGMVKILRDVRAAFDAARDVVDRLAIWDSNLDEGVDVAALNASLQQILESFRHAAIQQLADSPTDPAAQYRFAVAARAAAVLGKGDDALGQRIAQSESRRLLITTIWGGATNYFASLKEAEIWDQLSREAYALDRRDAAVFFAKRAVNLLQDSRWKLSRLFRREAPRVLPLAGEPIP